MIREFKIMKILIFIIFILIALMNILTVKLVVIETNKLDQKIIKLNKEQTELRLYYEDIIQLLEN